MAILYGTTADGDSLPVEVNEFGQLIAQGLQGQPGAEGPPGPPGIGQLPPDPFEGAFLGWQDDQLAWLGGVVPIPTNTYGPILSYENGVIGLDGLPLLSYGTALVMTDAQGVVATFSASTAPITSITAEGSSFRLTFDSNFGLADFEVGDIVQEAWGFNQSQLWRTFFTKATTGPGQEARAFDSKLDLQGGYFQNGVNWVPPTDSLKYEKSIEISDTVGQQYKLNGGEVTKTINSERETLVTGSGTLGGLNILRSVDPLTTHTPKGIWVDGNLLVDSDVSPQVPPAYVVEQVGLSPAFLVVSGGFWAVGDRVFGPDKSGTGSVQSVLEDAIILRADNGEWKAGYYVTAPEQLIAARYVAGTRMKNERLS